MTIGERIRKLRKKHGYSLRKVEELTNNQISYSYLSQIETVDKENPSREKLEVLAELFNVPLSYFYASEKTIEALTPEEQEFYEEILKDENKKIMLRESRGMSEEDLVKVIKIMKAFKDGKLD